MFIGLCRVKAALLILATSTPAEHSHYVYKLSDHEGKMFAIQVEIGDR